MSEPDGTTPLDPEEKEGLIFKHIGTRGELDQVEQVNIQEGLQWLSRQKVACEELLSDQFVRQLHQKLFGNVWRWAGVHRKTEKNIGVAPEQISVQLRQLLDNASYWVENKIYPSKELALRFHYRLVWIHPFPNGNGRHSRIMADAILTHCLSETCIDWGGRDLDKTGGIRSHYIHALREADKGHFEALFHLYN